MAKARYRVEEAQIVELSAATRAVVTDGVVYLHHRGGIAVLTVREAEVLAAVVGTGDGVPQAILSGLQAAGKLEVAA